MDGTLAGTTTPGQSGPGSNGYKGVCYNPQSSRTGDASIVLYLKHFLGRWGSYPSPEM